MRGAIQDYFKFRLSRPEILNRIGDNIVVFGFIAPDVAKEIFEGMVKNVVNRVRDEHKVTLVIAPEVRSRMSDWCTRDLSNGGRGIGNQLESMFVNPLSRALFSLPLEGRASVTVTKLEVDTGGVVTVELA